MPAHFDAAATRVPAQRSVSAGRVSMASHSRHSERSPSVGSSRVGGGHSSVAGAAPIRRVLMNLDTKTPRRSTSAGPSMSQLSLPTMVDEVNRKPNSGVGFRCTSPRISWTPRGAKPTDVQPQSYYTGGMATEKTRANVGHGFFSKTERFKVKKAEFQTTAPTVLPQELSQEALKKPNAGVGFRMTSDPRNGGHYGTSAIVAKPFRVLKSEPIWLKDIAKNNFRTRKQNEALEELRTAIHTAHFQKLKHHATFEDGGDALKSDFIAARVPADSHDALIAHFTFKRRLPTQSPLLVDMKRNMLENELQHLRNVAAETVDLPEEEGGFEGGLRTGEVYSPVPNNDPNETQPYIDEEEKKKDKEDARVRFLDSACAFGVSREVAIRVLRNFQGQLTGDIPNPAQLGSMVPPPRR